MAETLGLPEPRALEGRRGARLLCVQPGAVCRGGWGCQPFCGRADIQARPQCPHLQLKRISARQTTSLHVSDSQSRPDVLSML